MNRRDFLVGAGAAAVAAGVAASGDVKPAKAAANEFKLKYAPHFGMFKNHAPGGVIDELKFMADEGFMALEDNGMMGRSIEEQQSIADEMERLGMTMGVFVANAEFSKKTFVDGRDETREMIVNAMERAVETAKRVNATWTTVVPGMFDTRLEWDYQTANCIENLKHAAGVCEPHGLIMVLEPLNPWRDHPGLFLTKIPQAYQICQAVGSPSCKILDDLYHQQITEGNLIPNIDRAWEEIAYFQTGDNPGRKEPTTGEINYRTIFKHIHDKGFTGVVGMEHGNSQPGKEGERALINAYRWCDAFDAGYDV